MAKGTFQGTQLASPATFDDLSGNTLECTTAIINNVSGNGLTYANASIDSLFLTNLNSVGAGSINLTGPVLINDTGSLPALEIIDNGSSTYGFQINKNAIFNGGIFVNKIQPVSGNFLIEIGNSTSKIIFNLGGTDQLKWGRVVADPTNFLCAEFPQTVPTAGVLPALTHFVSLRLASGALYRIPCVV